ncbi:MAG: hypothetical protein QOG71_1922 [Pyrinomonadaceae bacterium]|nr:hypothetical protein [Pyrinomonadaceae bacterium]
MRDQVGRGSRAAGVTKGAANGCCAVGEMGGRAIGLCRVSASHAFPLHALIDAISARESPTYRSLDVQTYEFGRKSRNEGGDEGMGQQGEG